MTALAAATLQWLSARPGLFAGAPPVDLTRCNSCLAQPTALLVAAAPGGAYAYCARCASTGPEPTLAGTKSKARR